MTKIILGLAAAVVLICTGLVSSGAKAGPPIPAVKQQSMVEEVRWRRARVRRTYARRPVARRAYVGRPVVRRPIRRTWRRATRPLR